jgi:hypothetical protein
MELRDTRYVTRYVKTSDGVYIAYQITGEGPIDLVWQFDYVGDVDLMWVDFGWGSCTTAGALDCRAAASRPRTWRRA